MAKKLEDWLAEADEEEKKRSYKPYAQTADNQLLRDLVSSGKKAAYSTSGQKTALGNLIQNRKSADLQKSNQLLRTTANKAAKAKAYESVTSHQLNAPALITQEQKTAADDYDRWNSRLERSSQLAQTADGGRANLTDVTGKAQAGKASALKAVGIKAPFDSSSAATDAVNRTLLRSKEMEEKASSPMLSRDQIAANYAAAQEKQLQKKIDAAADLGNADRWADQYGRYLSLVEEGAERHGQTVEEYLQGEGAAYKTLLETDAELQKGKTFYEQRNSGTEFLPSKETQHARNLERYQGALHDMESEEADALLAQGKYSEWADRWNQAWSSASSEYAQKAEQLKLMRMSGRVDKAVLEAYEAELSDLEQEMEQLKLLSTSLSPDYEEKSAANPAYLGYMEYKLVNNGEEARKYADKTAQAGAHRKLYDYVGHLTDTERGRYNYLYETQGKEAAAEYLKDLQNRLEYRDAQKQAESDTKLAQEHPIVANAFSVLSAPEQLRAVIETGSAALTGQDVNPYGDSFATTRFKSAVRGATSEKIENPALNLIYNAGMSIADNANTMLLSGGNPSAAAVMMGVTAAAEQAYDNLIRGGSSQEAAIAGGTSAFVEWVTEKLGFDRLMDYVGTGKSYKTYKQLFTQFIKGFIPEGLEEVPGNFVDAAVDEYLMGGDSRRNQRVKELVGTGMAVNDAIAQTDTEFAGEVVMSFLAGGLAGGVMGAGSYGTGVYQGRRAAGADAQAIAQETGVDQKQLQQAMEMDRGLRKPDQAVIDGANASLEEAAETANRAVFKASATVHGKKATITGMSTSGRNPEVIVQQADGTETTAALDDVDFDNPEQMAAYRYASTYQDTDTARQFLSGYEMSRDTLDNYRQGFEAAYTAGYSGRQSVGAAATYENALRRDIRDLAYQAGKAAQKAQEARLNFDEDVSALVRKTVSALPRELAEGYTGAVNQVSGKLTSFQAAQMAVADQLAKKLGVVYTFVDSGAEITGAASLSGNDLVQGTYQSGSNQMVIALNASESSLLSVAGHETLHYVKEWAGQNETSRAMYEEFQTFVLDKLQAVEDYDLEGRIADKQAQYKRAGQELTRDAAIEEIVADSMTMVFATDENVQEFLESHDQTLTEKIVSVIKHLVNEIKAAIQRIARGNAEAAAMLKQDADTLQEISDRFDRLAVVARGVRESMQAAGQRQETQASAEDVESGNKAAKYSFTDFGMIPISETDAANANSRGWEVITSRSDLLHHIRTALSDNDQKSIFIGGIDETIKAKIIQNTGDSSLFKNGDYIFGIRYDNIVHLSEHFDDIGDIANVIEDMYRIFANYDSVEVLRSSSGHTKLQFKKDFLTVGIEGFTELSKRTRSATIETAYITHGGIKNWRGLYRTAILSSSNSSARKPLAENSIPHSGENSNPQQKFSLKDVDTPEFKRWFGDSEVTDDNGKPLVVYHTTRNDFFTFDKEKLGKVTDSNAANGYLAATAHVGFWFNTSPLDHRGIGNRVISAYLSAKNLYDAGSLDALTDDIWNTYQQQGYDFDAEDPTIEQAADAGDLFKSMLESRGYDGITLQDREFGGTSYVVFEPSQIKSATDNIGTFDPENPDIRYSLKDVDTTNDEMGRLLAENGELRGLVNQLSAQLKGKNGTALDPAAVRQLARRFKEDSGTRVPLKTLTENMQTAFNAMANARSSDQSQAAMEMMGSIAKDMLEKSTYAKRELFDQYEEMRKYFKSGIGLTSRQWQEVKKVYGSNKAFRQATASVLKVHAEGAGGVTLDNKWGELCEQWPAFFSEDTNEGDQVEAVLAALEAVQITYENPYGDNLNDYANDLAMLMYQEYMTIPEVKDGKTKQIEKLSRQLDEARASIRSQAAQVRKLGKLEAKIQEYRDAAAGRYQRQAQRRKDNQDYSKMRGQVIRQRDQLMRKLTEPKVGAFVPQSMHDAVMELLRSIDFEGKLEGFRDGRARRVLKRDAIDRAKEEYLALERPGADGARGPFAAFVNGDLESEFDLLARDADGMSARNLSMRQMEALRNIVAGYSAAVVNADRLFMQQRRDSLSAVGDEMAAGMYMRKEQLKQGKAAEWLRSATSKGLLKPVTIFHQFKGTPMETVWKALRSAENTHISHVSEAQDYLQKALTDYHQQESIRTEESRDKRAKAVEIALDDGRTVKLTDQELMTLYATFKREQKVGTNHLSVGGFTLANAPKGSSTAPMHIVGPTLQELLDKHLSKEQKSYVDHMVEYLSSTCADWGNEVTLQLYGVEKFHEEYYIPFTVNKNYVAQEPATEQDSRLKTGSFTKALTDKASAPIELKPFTELWCEHVEKMSDYNAFVLPIEDMTRLMNYKTVGESIRALMKRYYSPETADYIMNFLSRLNGNSRGEAGGSWLNAFMGKAKAAAVTFNASVAIQQMGSASRAMAMIDPKYFISGSVKAVFTNGSYKELEQYAPIAILKSWGYFDTNMARGLYTRAQNKPMDKLSDWGGKLAELGDRAAWAQIWEAVKLEISDTRADLAKGSEEYFQACADRFTEVIDGTQVVDSVFQRAEWATEKGMMKAHMAFMSEPLTMYNMLYRAGWDIHNAGSKEARTKAKKAMLRTGMAITISSAVTAALKSVVSALRDRNNEKKDEEGNIIGVRTGVDKWLDALGGNFAENMLGIGSIFTNMVQGAFSYYSSDLTTQWLSDFAGALTEAQKGVDADWGKAAYKMTRGLSSATGIGFGNLWRDVESIYHAADEWINRDSLAGAAWDTSLPFSTRLAAAEKNYVMKKQTGDKRKQNTGIYYDLMLAAYFDSGLGEDYKSATEAAIRTGGGANMWSTFKTHLRKAEDRLPQAAQALLDGDMTTYSRLYNELVEGDIGERAVASMIISEINALQPEEDVAPDSQSIVDELKRDDVDTDPVTKVQNLAYNAAIDAGSPKELKAAIDEMRKNGASDKDLRTKVTTSFRKAYCWAVWQGDTKASLHASEMMKGAGVAIGNDDLYEWTSKPTGSYASDTLHNLLKEGDGKQAHIVHKYLVEANGSAEVDKALKSWCNRYVKDAQEQVNVKTALKQMGYSQSTIDSWFN